MKTYYVMWFTDANHNTQVSKVIAESKAEAKAIIRDRARMRVHFISINESAEDIKNWLWLTNL